jgi:hypothetical protein
LASAATMRFASLIPAGLPVAPDPASAVPQKSNAATTASVAT